MVRRWRSSGRSGSQARLRTALSPIAAHLHTQRHVALVQTELVRPQRDRQSAGQGVAMRTHADPAAPPIDEESWQRVIIRNVRYSFAASHGPLVNGKTQTNTVMLIAPPEPTSSADVNHRQAFVIADRENGSLAGERARSSAAADCHQVFACVGLPHPHLDAARGAAGDPGLALGIRNVVFDRLTPTPTEAGGVVGEFADTGSVVGLRCEDC